MENIKAKIKRRFSHKDPERKISPGYCSLLPGQAEGIRFHVA